MFFQLYFWLISIKFKEDWFILSNPGTIYSTHTTHLHISQLTHFAWWTSWRTCIVTRFFFQNYEHKDLPISFTEDVQDTFTSCNTHFQNTHGQHFPGRLMQQGGKIKTGNIPTKPNLYQAHLSKYIVSMKSKLWSKIRTGHWTGGDNLSSWATFSSVYVCTNLLWVLYDPTQKT